MISENVRVALGRMKQLISRSVELGDFPNYGVKYEGMKTELIGLGAWDNEFDVISGRVGLAWVSPEKPLGRLSKLVEGKLV